MPIESLVHFPDVAAALGFKDTRAVKVLCRRYAVPVIRLNRRDRAIRTTDYQVLLARMSNFAEAA
jgi:hypothetical protein